MLRQRTLKFIKSCLASGNDAVNFVARNGVYYSRISSCVGRIRGNISALYESFKNFVAEFYRESVSCMSVCRFKIQVQSKKACYNLLCVKISSNKVVVEPLSYLTVYRC